MATSCQWRRVVRVKRRASRTASYLGGSAPDVALDDDSRSETSPFHNGLDTVTPPIHIRTTPYRHVLPRLPCGAHHAKAGGHALFRPEAGYAPLAEGGGC